MLENYYPDFYYESRKHIDLDLLRQKGIEGLILDIDNTLVPMHFKDADENAISWIKLVQEKGFKACILSNATKKRVERFNSNLSVLAIHRAYKPSGKAFLRAAETLGLSPEKVAVIGDQIFTDVYGGNKVNMITVLVKPIDKKEILFVRMKRLPEKWVLNSFNKNDETRLERRKLWKKNRFNMELNKYRK